MAKKTKKKSKDSQGDSLIDWNHPHQHQPDCPQVNSTLNNNTKMANNADPEEGQNMGYPIITYPHGYDGYLTGFGDGKEKSYGSDGGFRYMRSYDPNYLEAFPEGPSVEEKWKKSYPYVPTSFSNTSSNGRIFDEPDSNPSPESHENGGLHSHHSHHHKNGTVTSSKKGGTISSQRSRRLSELGEGSTFGNSDNPILFGPDSLLASKSGAIVSKTGSITKRPIEKDSTLGKKGKSRNSSLSTGFRENWSSTAEFVLSSLGFSVGLGNFWRFPIVMFLNGGVAFLIAYFFLLILIGQPMYLMEMALGQFVQGGPVGGVWSMFPLAKGIGFSMLAASLIASLYHNVILGYAVFYGYSSVVVNSSLPWMTCDQSWGANLETCFNITEATCPQREGCQRSAAQFWERGVLGIHEYSPEKTSSPSTALETPRNLGEIRWNIFGSVAAVWFMVFLCICRGVKSSGKTVYLTVTLPYIILVALLVRGCMLEGALGGIKSFFLPSSKLESIFGQLGSVEVWRQAAKEMFLSLGLSWGGLITLSSYNKFRTRNLHIWTCLITTLNLLTSILFGLVIFSAMGGLQQRLGVPNIVELLTADKFGMAFIVYPGALGLLFEPLPQIWAFIFFLAIFLLGLTTQTVLTETIASGFRDLFPRLRTKKFLVSFLTCFACFGLSLPFCFGSGKFVLDLVNNYAGIFSDSANLAIFLIAILETVVIMWFYGVNRFSTDVHFMLNFRPGFILKTLWSLVVPLFLMAFFGYSIYVFNDQQDLKLSTWALWTGRGLMLGVVALIPIGAVFVFGYFSIKGTPSHAFRPQKSWGPGVTGEWHEWARFRSEQKRSRR